MSPTPPPRNVLTLAMTVEYNGFAYAGFQRQTATPPRSNARISLPLTDNDNDAAIAIPGKRKTQQQQAQPNNHRKNKKPRTSDPTTIQQQIESALQRWTSLSIATLRVRGAGRTDKGVHASGQVVAFDVPLHLLQTCAGDSISSRNIKDCGSFNGNECKSEGEQHCQEVLLQHALPLFQKAYNDLTDYVDTKNTHAITNNKQHTDQWEIRRAIATRLPSDIVIRSVWIWTGSHPFEARENIICKTYTYNLRFRCLGFFNDDDSKVHSSSQQQPRQGTKSNSTSQIIHPICNAGPHLLRRTSDQNAVWLCPWSLDPTKLSHACREFVGNHNFYNFVHKEERRKISLSEDNEVVEKMNPHQIDLFEFTVDLLNEVTDGDVLNSIGIENPPSSSLSLVPPVINATFRLKAKGFHRSMVRMLVGFVVDVARGFRCVEDIPALLTKEEKGKIKPIIVKSCDMDGYSCDSAPTNTVHAAPACGLSLARVDYEHEKFL